LVLAAWDSLFVWPLRLFVVFLHEVSHGLAAVATGGAIVRIELSPAEGGLCVTRGGSRFLVLSAGYLGSLAWGLLILAAGARGRRDRPAAGALGLMTLVVTLVYVRSLFGFVYGLGAGTALLIVAWRLPAAASDAVLVVVGTVSCLYAPWDVASDVLLRDIPGSDAHALAELTGVPASAWGLFWMATSLIATALALRRLARR
jgi:hypothetical protein